MPRVALLAAVLIVTAACGDGGPSAGTTPTTAPVTTNSTIDAATTTLATTTTPPPDALPPYELGPLAELFDPIVRPLGYEVSRGALIDRDTYEVDPEGGHLALYLAPLEDISFDTYAADFALIAEALIPMVFATWPGLDSFDVCQEEYDSDQETPPSLTIVDLTAEAASAVEWEGLELETLIDYGSEVDGISVWARGGVRESAIWRAAAGS